MGPAPGVCVSALLIHTSASSSATLTHPLPLPLPGWAASITFTSSPPELCLPPPRPSPSSQAPCCPARVLWGPEMRRGVCCAFPLFPASYWNSACTHTTHTQSHKQGPAVSAERRVLRAPPRADLGAQVLSNARGLAPGGLWDLGARGVTGFVPLGTGTGNRTGGWRWSSLQGTARVVPPPPAHIP